MGRGVAYGTGDPAHLQNVPAGRMGAWADAPGGFAEVCGLEPDGFAERRAYGDYLVRQLEEVAASGLVTLVGGAVAAARPIAGCPSTTPSSGRGPPPRASSGRKWRVELDDGRVITADQVVLATGNGRPSPFAIAGWPEAAMVQDPWSGEAAARLAEIGRSGAPLLLIGTGLTMVDVVLTLDRLGPSTGSGQASVTAVSRRGLVPRAHEHGVPAMAAPELGEVPERLSDAVAWLRARGAEPGWRAAVDSLRPVTQALWAGWPEDKKARFLRHARPWWDVHRHRIAPDAAAVLERWQSEGRLEILAGPSIRACGATQDERGVVIRLRGGGERHVAAELAVNCTGPAERLGDGANPLLARMLGDGLIAAGELGLGVRVDADSRAGPGLWAVGPPTRGRWWEITAVPDIRVQAERVARAIAAAAAG